MGHGSRSQQGIRTRLCTDYEYSHHFGLRNSTFTLTIDKATKKGNANKAHVTAEVPRGERTTKPTGARCIWICNLLLCLALRLAAQ